MTKKLSTFLFALFLHMEANAYDTEINGIFYNLDQTAQAAIVTYKSSKPSLNSSAYSGEVAIPSVVTFNGVTYSVTSIDNEAFKGCTNLTSIVIPNSVTSIGKYAFYFCKALTSVTIPNSISSINDGTFYECI